MTGWSTEELIGKPVSTILNQLRVPRSTGQQDDLFTGAARLPVAGQLLVTTSWGLLLAFSSELNEVGVSLFATSCFISKLTAVAPMLF